MLKFINGNEVIRDSIGSNSLELLIAGDCCPRNECEQLVLDGKSSQIIADIKPFLEDCDLSLVQFETPLSNNGEAISKDGPNIRVAPECVEFVKECGFDIAALANNHIGDFGHIPIFDTIKTLNERGIVPFGAGKNIAEASKPLFIEKKSHKVAFLNYAENEYGIAGKNRPGASPLEPLTNVKQIEKTSKLADSTIVIVHGGNEFCPVPSPRMKKTYRAFAEAGADAVINIHTHCPQGIEIWKGTPIIYSLGNFYFDSSFDFCTHNMWSVGYMAKLYIDKQGVFQISVFPYNIEFDGTRINSFPSSKRQLFNSYLSKLSSIISDEDESEKLFSAWAAMHGKDYFKYFAPFTKNDFSDENSEKLSTSPSVRNILSCEAHNEVFKTYMRLYHDGKLDESKKYYEQIKDLQNPYKNGFIK